MAQIHEPSQTDRKAFLEKLGEFRSTLPESQQHLLDAMALAAFRPEGADVQGYGWQPIVAPMAVPVQQVYVGPYGGAWVGTAWATSYNVVGATWNPFIP
jgi:hypothetical protein